ncbi:uncharacterized protein LOC131221676 [Magnolia sinica]|uniref:uncharacterized protein LOC131221676 n=1 Tax=Magnolia sinica TaxID=86752 RepID=UPI0026584BD9|nr:uncharacterized protein LOC131221676 [Magnolia sinica]
MRFSNLVSCLGVLGTRRRREEARPLVPLTCAGGEDYPWRRRKRGRRNSSAWRPSLVAISEDSGGSVGPTGEGERTVRSGKDVAGKNKSRSKTRSHNDWGRFPHSTAQAVFPGFSSTAFLF